MLYPKKFNVGDLVYHDSKTYGSKWAIVVEINDGASDSHGTFAILWMDRAHEKYHFANDRWIGPKHFKLVAKAK